MKRLRAPGFGKAPSLTFETGTSDRQPIIGARQTAEEDRAVSWNSARSSNPKKRYLTRKALQTTEGGKVPRS